MSLDHPADFVKRQTLRRDGFLGSRLRVAQPESGFRAGLDSVLLGAAVRTGSQTLLDLGSGAGVAGLVALANDRELDATLVDSDPAVVALAADNLLTNGFSPRARAYALDLTAPETRTGLPRDHFGAIIANPPFFASGTPAAPARQAARQMPESALDLWARTAATHAAPGGEVIFVHVALVLSKLLAALDSRFGGLTILPLAPRPGEPAHRILVRGIKGSRAPLSLLATRAVHATEGRTFAPEFEAIFRGDARLLW